MPPDQSQFHAGVPFEFADGVEALRKRLGFPDLGSKSGFREFPRSSTIYTAALKREWHSKSRDRALIIPLIQHLMVDDQIMRCFASNDFVDIFTEAMSDEMLTRMGIGSMATTLHFILSGSSRAAQVDPLLRKYIAEKASVPAYNVARAKQTGEDVYDLDYEFSIKLLSESVLDRKEPDGTTSFYLPYLDVEQAIDVFVIACMVHDPNLALFALQGALSLAKSLPQDRFWHMSSFHEMLVGYLRHPSFGVRCSVFQFLWDKVILHAQPEPPAFEALIGQKVADFLEEDDDAKALHDTWIKNGGSLQDSFRIAKAAVEKPFKDAVDVFYEDNNFYKLGESLYNVIKSTEHFTVGRFETPVKVPGMPYLRIADMAEMLPICARAIREQDGNTSLRAACLDLKYLLLNRQYQQAWCLARKQLEYDSDSIYLYYALSMGNSSFQTLLDCRKGLLLISKETQKTSSSYMRMGLLHNAIAAEITLARTMAGVDDIGKQYRPPGYIEGAYVLGQCALAHGLEFLRASSPDNPAFSRTIHYHMCFSVVLYGPSLSPDLREFSELVHTARTVSRLARATYYRASNLRTAFEILWTDVIKKHFEYAAHKFEDVFRAHENAPLDDNLLSHRMRQPIGRPEGGKPLFDCATKLGETFMRDEFNGVDDEWTLTMLGAPVDDEPHAFAYLTLYGDVIKMQLCAECRRSSVSLKRCARCGKVRYCNRDCQSRHWKRHKINCKK